MNLLPDHDSVWRHPKAPLLIGTVAAGTLIYGFPPGIARDFATIALVGFIPGLAIVPWLGVRDRGMRLTLVLLISLSLTVLAAQAVMYTFSLKWAPCAGLLLGISALSTSARMIADPVDRDER